MKQQRWIMWVAIGGLLLSACTTPTEATSNPACDSHVRCRAWVLFASDNPAAAATEMEGLLTEGEDDFVVIRADVVRGTYNLVVPVDAANQEQFDIVLGMLTQIAGSEPVVLYVDEHHPAQTTRSHSFVTEGEREGFEGEFPEPGRQAPNSPGANPWG